MSSYDLAFEIDGGTFRRIQCKHAARKGDVIIVRLVSNRRGPKGFIRTRYTADEIDAVAAYCPRSTIATTCPWTFVATGCCVYLRLAPTRNGQRAALNFAADYPSGL